MSNLATVSRIGGIVASNMKYCHICKAMAFVKSQLSSVVSLDCGHMAKVKGDDGPPERRSKEDIQRERAAVRRYIPPPTLQPSVAAPRPRRVHVPEPIVVEAKPVTPPAPTRPHRRTNDVTKTLKDLIDGKDFK